MKTPLLLPRLTVLAIATAALVLIGNSSFAAKAGIEDHSTPQPTSDQLAKLPVEHAFVKEKTGDNKGLYTLTLKNTSAKALKVSAAVEESVTSHNKPKNHTESSTIEPGKSWKIEALAAHDKVTVSADGFAPLSLSVP